MSKPALYLKYKSLFSLSDNRAMRAFEEFLLNESLYDLIEFSRKYEWDGRRYQCNPQRFSVWKYGFDTVKDRAFWEAGLACFEQIAAGTSALAQMRRFSLTSAQELELRYISFGLEGSPDEAKTRMKLYKGYALPTDHQACSISRTEVSLTGSSKSDEYQGMRRSHPKFRMLTANWPEDTFFYTYAQHDRLHFKIHPSASSALLDPLGKLLRDDPCVMNDCRRLRENGFRFWVLTMREDEIGQNRLENFTIYFRGADV